MAPGSRTKPPAKGKDQSAKPEEVTELNFGAPLFQALARFLTIGQSMAILAAMFVEGLLNATPEEILREVEERVDEKLQATHPIRFCGAHLKGKCRFGHKCRNLHLDEEGMRDWVFRAEGYTTGKKPVAAFIVARYGLRKTKHGDIVCDRTPRRNFRSGSGQTRRAVRGELYEVEEAVTLLLRASLMRAKVFLARDPRQGKAPQTFTLGLSIKLNGQEFTATCMEDLFRMVTREDPEWGTWKEGADSCVPEGYLLHPASKDEGYVLGTIFGLTNNPNLLKTHPQYKAERQRVSGRNDRDAMIGGTSQGGVLGVDRDPSAEGGNLEVGPPLRESLKVPRSGTTKEYCDLCGAALKTR